VSAMSTPSRRVATRPAPASTSEAAPVTTTVDPTEQELAGIRYDAAGLVPAIAQDASTHEVLMMGWMSPETVRLTFAEGRMVYWSRSRREVWRKGATSGAVQHVVEARYDCDADVLLFLVRQDGDGACHTGARSCFFRRFGVRSSVDGDPSHAAPAE